MKHIRNGSIFSVLMLVLLSACAPATPTPPAGGGCNVTGCPYPAVCNQTSGVCEIQETPAPGGLAPQAPGAGIVANNPGGGLQVAPSPSPTASAMPPGAKSPGGVGPIAANPGNVGSVLPASCVPPTPSISQINEYCNAKPSLGGASFTVVASDVSGGWPQNVSCKLTQLPGQTDYTCTGAQATSFQILACSSCGGPLKFGSAALGDYTCSDGYVKQSDGTCYPANTTTPYVACPAGSHYDTAQQYCLDDITNQKLADFCPAGTVAYYPEYHFCMTQSYPAAFDCQLFTVPLGACLQAKPSCKAPIGGCTPDPLNGAARSWDTATCSCK